MDQQTLERLDLHVGVRRADLAHQRQALLDGEQRCTRAVDADRHVHLREQLRGALDQVQMAERRRIEATRVDGQLRLTHGLAPVAGFGAAPALAGPAGGLPAPALLLASSLSSSSYMLSSIG